MDLQKRSEHDICAGPCTRYCPVGVYEWAEKDGEDFFVINAQNCVRSKACDIKHRNHNINWAPSHGGEVLLFHVEAIKIEEYAEKLAQRLVN